MPQERWRSLEPRETFFIAHCQKRHFYLGVRWFSTVLEANREKRENGISGKKQEQLLAEKRSLTSDLELDNAGRGKKEINICKYEGFTSPAPKFPILWEKQPQTELSATKKIKILASAFSFCLHGLVCFTQQIVQNCVLNWRWKGIGFRGNVGKVWM